MRKKGSHFLYHTRFHVFLCRWVQPPQTTSLKAKTYIEHACRPLYWHHLQLWSPQIEMPLAHPLLPYTTVVQYLFLNIAIFLKQLQIPHSISIRPDSNSSSLPLWYKELKEEMRIGWFERNVIASTGFCSDVRRRNFTKCSYFCVNLSCRGRRNLLGSLHHHSLLLHHIHCTVLYCVGDSFEWLVLCLSVSGFRNRLIYAHQPMKLERSHLSDCFDCYLLYTLLKIAPYLLFTKLFCFNQKNLIQSR